MLIELLLAFFFTAVQDVKDWFGRARAWSSDIFFIHVWHRRHVFTSREIIHARDSTDNAVCMFCSKTLGQVTGGKADFKVLMAVLLLCGFVRAAGFDTVQIGAGFIYDSTFQVRVFADSVDCGQPRFPCLLRVEDGLGQGESVNVTGRPGDTLKVACAFRRALLPGNAGTVTLTFYDPAWKAPVATTAKMGFKDPKPSALQRPGKARARPAWRSLATFRADGRVKP
jgi:hypothetical protein